MKKVLRSLLFAVVMLFGISAFAQNTMIELSIIQNGEPITDTVEYPDGSYQVITIQTSSDDAEQENDEMDALLDDDLDAGWEGDPEDQNILTTGLRFQNVSIPKGATIDSAYFVLCSHEAKTADDVAIITIAGNAADNAETFDLDNLITDRAETSAKVVWTCNEEWGLWTFHKTPDVSAIIQELVDREGWSYGNAMAFMFKGEDQGPSDVENAREFESFENIADPEDGGDGQNHPERRPVLRVYYSFPASIFERQIMVNGEPITDTVEYPDGSFQVITIETSSDDAEQENDEMDSLFDDDLDAGWEGDPEDQNVLTTGLRFADISIPKGVTIDSAYIVVCSHEAKTADDVAELSIYGEASDNAATYDLDNLIESRDKTTAMVNWTVAEEWGLWTYHRTPDIGSIVQEIIDRDGWASGNPVNIMIFGNDQGPSDVENAREFESFENIADPEDGGDGQNHPERRPKLVVYYSGESSIGEGYTSLQSLDIYPNPTQDGYVNLTFEDEAPANVKVFDQSGKLVLTNDFGATRAATINVSNLTKGVYILKATQGSANYSQKLIVR